MFVDHIGIDLAKNQGLSGSRNRTRPSRQPIGAGRTMLTSTWLRG
jgi:hypothetical protein